MPASAAAATSVDPVPLATCLGRASYPSDPERGHDVGPSASVPGGGRRRDEALEPRTFGRPPQLGLILDFAEAACNVEVS